MKNKLFQIVLLMGLAIAVFSCEKEEIPSSLKYTLSESVLTLRSAYAMSEVKMYDDIGKLVEERYFEETDRVHTVRIDLKQNLAIGIYTVTVISEITTDTIRVLIN